MWFWATALLSGQTAENVLVVVNRNSPLSRQIGEYYIPRRHIPAANVCWLNAKLTEEISRDEYDKQIAQPIGEFLRAGHLTEKILYIVTTSGVPLRIQGSGGQLAEQASVDSELTLLYSDLRGKHTGCPRASQIRCSARWARYFVIRTFPFIW